MEIKVMFPTDVKTADIMATNCAAGMKSTRKLQPAHMMKMQIFKTIANRDGGTGEILDERHKIEHGCRQAGRTFITDENVHSFLGSRVACGLEYLTGESKMMWSDRKGQKCEHVNQCVTRMLRDAKRMHHWGVFENFNATVSVSGVSRALTHQLVRHRLFSYLQQSQRQVDPSKNLDWFVTPESVKALERIDPAKTGFEKGYALTEYKELMGKIARLYSRLVGYGVPDEDARYVLPNACFTNIMISGNARQWLHFFKMRCKPPAQWEIMELACAIREELMKLSPVIFEGAGELEV